MTELVNICVHFLHCLEPLYKILLIRKFSGAFYIRETSPLRSYVKINTREIVKSLCRLLI